MTLNLLDREATQIVATFFNEACNTFNGKTADEIADFIQDEIHDMLFDIEQVVGVTSDLTALYSNNDEHWLPPWLWSQGRS